MGLIRIAKGDSGGTVYDYSSYLGIVIAKMRIDDKMHTIFVPWDHITESIDGLTFIPYESPKKSK